MLKARSGSSRCRWGIRSYVASQLATLLRPDGCGDDTVVHREGPECCQRSLGVAESDRRQAVGSDHVGQSPCREPVACVCSIGPRHEHAVIGMTNETMLVSTLRKVSLRADKYGRGHCGVGQACSGLWPRRPSQTEGARERRITGHRSDAAGAGTVPLQTDYSEPTPVLNHRWRRTGIGIGKTSAELGGETLARIARKFGRTAVDPDTCAAKLDSSGRFRVREYLFSVPHRQTRRGEPRRTRPTFSLTSLL